ncbi:putative adenine permease PurP [Poriferisphaera corsica]|uniref:Putative adenine permease PurP n=1 Tax=Poriferisphaera corsica TaxID=2528020 RepID=A0A517YXW5_9BACT|nr:NCS2 family permease [Poriferisphaera corsica]QDU35070.1 putative adenine permease PurP [Poriferisphaera corsica]
MLNKIFQLQDNNTNVRTEVLAGITTFLTMAYIIFVQANLMSSSGIESGAAIMATCLASAFATLLMGLWAKYPIALAPGMGVNAYFAYTLIPALQEEGYAAPWQVGLGVVFVAGLAFILLTAVGIRETIMNAISRSMKNAIAVGIGLFIAFIGLKNATVIAPHAATYITLTDNLLNPDLAVFLVGLFVAAACHDRKIKGSILLGILASFITAIALKNILPMTAWAESDFVTNSALMQQFTLTHVTENGILETPPSIMPTLLQMDIAAVFSTFVFPFVIIFLFIDMFDTMGTLIGVSEQAGFVKDGKIPRVGKAMGADALGTTVGATLGTSTVTAYIESAAGVEQGGRTGLTAVVVAIGFLLAIFFTPVIQIIASYPSITAPALVIVGAMMIRNVVRIDWDDYSESIPAFLIIVGIPFSFSIGDGMAIGFIAYPIIKVLSGKRKDLNFTSVVLAIALLGYFIFLRAEF